MFKKIFFYHRIGINLFVKFFYYVFYVSIGTVEVYRYDDEALLHIEYLRTGDDRLAATMRAITQAAAEIGSGMKT